MLGFDDVESEKGSSLLEPGIVGVKLDAVSLTDDGDLDITFVGTDEGNTGSFKPRFWVNNQDPNDERYNETKAKRFKAHLKHILEGFLTVEEISAIKAETTPQLFQACAAALTAAIGKTGTMKVVYKWGSDSLCVVPFYGPFLSTDLKKRTLSIGTKKGNDGLPFDRVLPAAEYGVVATGEAPSQFNSPDDVNLPFGG